MRWMGMAVKVLITRYYERQLSVTHLNSGIHSHRSNSWLDGCIRNSTWVINHNRHSTSLGKLQKIGDYKWKVSSLKLHTCLRSVPFRSLQDYRLGHRCSVILRDLNLDMGIKHHNNQGAVPIWSAFDWVPVVPDSKSLVRGSILNRYGW